MIKKIIFGTLIAFKTLTTNVQNPSKTRIPRDQGNPILARAIIAHNIKRKPNKLTDKTMLSGMQLSQKEKDLIILHHALIHRINVDFIHKPAQTILLQNPLYINYDTFRNIHTENLASALLFLTKSKGIAIKKSFLKKHFSTAHYRGESNFEAKIFQLQRLAQ